MDTRKKACPNEKCETYRKKKYSSATNYCPICGEKLVYVCASPKCYTVLEDKGPEHKICEPCMQKILDAKDKTFSACKKVGGVLLTFAGGALCVFKDSFVDVGEKALHNAGKNAGKKVIDAAKNIIKK